MVKEVSDQQAQIGVDFLSALAARDFSRLGMAFRPDVKFRAVVPDRLREGGNPAETTAWFVKWFGDAETLTIVNSSSEMVADKLHIGYRVRVLYKTGYETVEQHAFCNLADGQISTMDLVCSGFRPDPAPRNEQDGDTADAYYDAGTRGCAEGPLDEIAGIMRGLAPGQTLLVRAEDPSVSRDLPAWCRLVGHEVVRQEGQTYLVRHK